MEYHTASPWGYLFTEEKKPTPLFKSLLRAIADHIIHELEPKKVRYLTPEKLAAFYRQVGGNLDSLFLETEPTILSDLFTTLGCRHSLLPDPKDDFAPPRIPALHTRGFEKWQVIQVLLEPEEHAPYIMEAVKKFSLVDKSSGRFFIREYGELSREAFPEGPDPDTEKWHEGVFRKRIEDEKEKEKQKERDGWLPNDDGRNKKTNGSGVHTGGSSRNRSGPANAGGGRPSSRASDESMEGLGIRVDEPSESEKGESYSTARPTVRHHSRVPSPRSRSRGRGRGGYDSPSYSPQHSSSRVRDSSSPSPAPKRPSKGYRSQPYGTSPSARHSPLIFSDSEGERPSRYRSRLHPEMHSSKVHYIFDNGDEQSMDEANIRSVSPGDTSYVPSPPDSRGRDRSSRSRGRSAEPYHRPYYNYERYTTAATPGERLPTSRGATPDPYAYPHDGYHYPHQPLNTSRSHGQLRASTGGMHYPPGANGSGPCFNSYPKRHRSCGIHSHDSSRGPSPFRQPSFQLNGGGVTAGGGAYTQGKSNGHNKSGSPTLTVDLEGNLTFHGEIPIPPPPPPPAPAVSSSSSTNPPVSTGGISAKNTPKFQAAVSSDSEDDYDFLRKAPRYHDPYNTYHSHRPDTYLGNGLGISNGHSSSKRYSEQEFLHGRRERLRDWGSSNGVSMGGVGYGVGVGIGGGNLMYTTGVYEMGGRYGMR